MNSMFDFITHVKGVEYILSIALIAGYLLVWEALKPRPFRTVKETGREDLAHLKQTGMKNTLRLAGKIATAPFVGLMYIVLLPVGLVSAVTYSLVARVAGNSESFSWRPMEAYLSGKKKTKKHETDDNKQSENK
jgi:hypothetical protein